jgi:nicotinate-nucleotide adenylyltransferase
MSEKKPRRIGIFSGSFDPVHQGHVAFALASLQNADLDKVYFAPEVKPRRKPHISHIAHRVQMLELAITEHPELGVLELPNRYFLPKTTIPQLQQRFRNDDLILLFGSDLFERLHTWPHVEYLLSNAGVAVGVRGNYEVSRVLQNALNLPNPPKELHAIDATLRELSSKNIRQALESNVMPDGIAPQVHDYARKHWLYHDISKINRPGIQ